MREFYMNIWFNFNYLRKAYVHHLFERFFKQIIECSDIGIEPETEHELEELRAFALETGEPEDNSEYIIKVNTLCLLMKRWEFWIKIK